MAEEGPLTAADLVDLKRNLTDLDRAEKMIEQAQRAGIDVGTQKERATEMRDKLMRLKQAFFPGQ